MEPCGYMTTGSCLASRLAAENIALWSPHTVSRDEQLFPPPHVDVPASFA
jgi:hypothetical protein